MNLDIARWIDYIPDKILIVIKGAGYGLFTIGMFWFSYVCLDFRHPMYGQNHSYMPVWERIPFGCFGGAFGIGLVVHGIKEIWHTWKQPAVRSRANGEKKPIR